MKPLSLPELQIHVDGMRDELSMLGAKLMLTNAVRYGEVAENMRQARLQLDVAALHLRELEMQEELSNG